MSAIEWTDYTVNPGIYGCTEVSPACANCYAAKMAHRLVAMNVYPAGITEKRASGVHWNGTVLVNFDAIEKAFSKLPKRKPARVFVTSMSDLFHPDVPFDFISQVFDHMRAMPHLTFQVLTKRAERMAEWAEWAEAEWEDLCEAVVGGEVVASAGPVWPSNVWAGCTAEDQKRADERLPWLLKVPAAVRFLSCEPLLGPVDLAEWLEPIDHCGSCNAESPPHAEDICPECEAEGCTISTYGYAQAERYRTGERYDEDSALGRDDIAGASGVSWVISGGESGPKARPSNPQWFRDIRDQCKAADVAYLHKQNGEHIERTLSDPDDFDGQTMHVWRRWQGAEGWEDGGALVSERVGKKAAGRLLDGVTHDAFPE